MEVKPVTVLNIIAVSLLTKYALFLSSFFFKLMLMSVSTVLVVVASSPF